MQAPAAASPLPHPPHTHAHRRHAHRRHAHPARTCAPHLHVRQAVKVRGDERVVWAQLVQQLQEGAAGAGDVHGLARGGRLDLYGRGTGREGGREGSEGTNWGFVSNQNAKTSPPPPPRVYV